MKRLLALLVTLGLSLVLLSCGGSTTPPVTKNFTLVLSPNNPTAAAGANATVNVTVTPTGFSASDSVALSINNPANVTANFNPASTSGTSTLTLSSNDAGVYSMTVTGTGPGGPETATLTFTVTAVANPDFSISLSNSTPSIAEGGNTNVTVTVNATGGFSEAVNLTINNPANVTANFNPTSTTAASTLTLGSAAAGSYAMTVTGTSGNLTKTANLTLTVNPQATVTVNGLVTDLNNQPVANVPVVIFGGNNPARIETQATGTTGNDGRFSISGITIPYDIAAIFSGQNAAISYDDLSRTDPTLIAPFGIAGVNTATINGTVSGGAGYALPSNHVDQGVFGSPEVNRQFNINDSSGDFDTTVSWFGNNQTTGMIHVLQWERDNNGFPTDYTGYGNSNGPVTLVNNNTSNNNDIALTGVGDQNAGGNVTVPQGYTLDSKDMIINFDANSSINVLRTFDGNPNFNYVTPGINGATLSFETSAFDSANRFSLVRDSGFATDNNTISLSVPAAPVETLPVNNAPGITKTTEFSWVGFGAAQSGHLVSFTRTGGPNFFVFTANTSTTLPDLSAQGLGIPANTSYDWDIVGLSPFSNGDALASNQLADVLAERATDFALGFSDTRSFTTSATP